MSPAFVAPGDGNTHSPAAILLGCVPEAEQTGVLMSLIGSLQRGDHFGIACVASIVLERRDKTARQSFLAFLNEAIRVGEIQSAADLSQQYPLLGWELLDRAIEVISKAKSLEKEDQPDDLALQSYLSFTKSILPNLPIRNAHTVLLEGCLGLMSAGNSIVSLLAKNVILTILSTHDEAALDTLVLPCQHQVWKCIEQLTTSNLKTNSLHGYSLWLRWTLAGNGRYISQFITNQYWQRLMDGLRRGDPERRKLCLNILKLTVAADTTIVSDHEREQYYRFCTVFETIVLGRYINQIQECEKDLDFLATDSSVPLRWLYMLLASALDNQMQESNRKFIGNWVMQSALKPTPEFVEFLKVDFVPWAIQGRLFVSTLRRRNGELRCEHGDRLAGFFRRLIKASSHPDQLATVIIETLAEGQASIFAYAVVYLLEGLDRPLRKSDVHILQRIASLPEVARDYVATRVQQTMDSVSPGRLISRREALEQEAIMKCRSFDPNIDSLEDIWNDLDYLEYPKKLLMVMSEIVVHPQLVQRASKSSSLATDLKQKLATLLNIAKTKTYLFSSLMVALRHAMIAVPAAARTLKVEDVIMKVADSRPEPTVDLLLEEATLHLTPFSYEQYFGERLSYGFAAFIDMVSRLHDHQDVLERVLNTILLRWKDQKVPPPVVSPWKNSLQLQVLLLCFEQFDAPETQVGLQLENLFHVLAIEPLPEYRYLFEWTIVRLLLRYEIGDNLLQRLVTKDHHSNSKHLASMMKIGVILACHQDTTEDFTLRLATSFIPLAASSKVVIRHEAQWQFPELMDRSRANKWASITENPAFTALDDYIRSLERFHEPPPERRIDRFDPGKDHTLANLVDGPWYGLDSIEAPLTNRAEFVKLYRNDSDVQLPESRMPLGDHLEKLALNTANSTDSTTKSTSTAVATIDEVPALQTKGAAYLARALLHSSSGHDRNEKLVVVASFVENPYNLGGVCRVAEVFGSSALCLPNRNVVSNKDFTSVSVSSHLHVPIVQLSAPGMPAYLAERKMEGFTIVGVEQTDRSTIVGSEGAQLPEKMVLVVGSEKEGIPAIVLTVCDMLVEIPQQGITRSLNVQTAVSIVLYEHARQHR